MIFGGGGRHRGQAHHEPGVRRPLRFLIEEFQDHHTRITYMHTLQLLQQNISRERVPLRQTHGTLVRGQTLLCKLMRTLRRWTSCSSVVKGRKAGENLAPKRHESRREAALLLSGYIGPVNTHTHFLASLTLCSDPETHRRTTLPSATPLPTLNQTMAAATAAAVLCFCAPKSCSFLFHLYPVRA